MLLVDERKKATTTQKITTNNHTNKNTPSFNPNQASKMKRPNPSSIPTFIQKTLNLEPCTEIVIQLFSDRIFIVITQLSGKLGTLLQCTHEHSEIDNSHTYHVETLLGKRDDTLNEVYARQITERILKLGEGGVNCPPILLGIALKEECKSPEMFHSIIEEVINLYQDGIKVASSTSK